ncbi:hypothetical protein LSAT2_014232 [Lamellibrachia satsuma]|nr:hypothetical protein LSAT2_014232 [Lamellibrachia satsuma]
MKNSTDNSLTDTILASHSTTYWKITGGVLIGMASIAVLCNALVGCTLLTNRQLRKDPNNVLLANLAVADGLFACALVFIGYWNTTAGLYPFGTLSCRFHTLFMVSSSQASNNILAAMSAVKLIHVGFPFTSEKIMQPIVIGALCVMCWLPPFIWNSATFLFSFGMKQFLMPICYPVMATIINYTNTLCFFFAQLITIVIATGLVLRIVRRHHKSIGVLTAGAPNVVAAAGATSSWKAVRTLVVVVAAFLLMQAPLYFVTLANGICQCLPYQLVYEYAMYPFYMNCVVNVFIYFVLEPRFRKAAVQLLSCGRFGDSH